MESSPCAGRTDAFYDVIDGARTETFRKVDERSGNVFKTESLVADFAVEMRVHVGYGAVVFAFAHFEFYRSRTVVDGMHEMVLLEYLEGPEYA